MGISVSHCCDKEADPTSEQQIRRAHSDRETSLQEAKEITAAVFPQLRRVISSQILLIPSDSQDRINALKSNMTGKRLRLRVLNSGNLSRGTVLSITPQGLEGSLRNLPDGFVFFGHKKRSEPTETNKGPIINDFIIPVSPAEDSVPQRGRHFCIFYSIDRDSYYLRDLAQGNAFFVKLEFPLVKPSQLLKDNHILGIGEGFVVVNIFPESEQHGSRLRLKVFGGKSTGEIFYFEAKDHVDHCIQIGRHKSCVIKLDDNLLSKVQCSVFYNPTAGWTLIDGDITKHRASTNGSWLTLNEDFEVYNGLVFKTYQTLFQVRHRQANILNE